MMEGMLNIRYVAAYESKLLFRSWFLRIFTLIALTALGFFNYFMVTTETDMDWSIAALGANVPYMVLMMFNLVQAILVVFLASDFIRRDNTLDTSKVIFVRPVSNMQYYIGKTLGILYVFLILNFIILTQAFIINIGSKLVPVDFLAYACYPFLISIPTLVFLIGLSYLFITLTGNQAVSFILLLAYVALTSFYLGSKLNNMLDFMAYRVPMSKSDFIGFGDFTHILIHRGMYVLYGIGFIFLSVYFMKRLPNSQSKLPSLLLAVLFIGSGLFLTYTFLADISRTKRERKASIELNNQYAGMATVDITQYELDVDHKGRNIQVICLIDFMYPEKNQLDKIVLNLNEGLKIVQVKLNEKEVTYERKKDLLIIENEGQGRKKGVLEIHYQGHPSETLCYLDADSDTLSNERHVFLLNLGSQYSMLTPDYVLLTPETAWYPMAGTRYNTIRRYRKLTDFANYNISVNTADHLTAISQGIPTKEGSGRFTFQSDLPLPQVTLIIGEYEKLAITVDSIEYAIYRKKNHLYWTQHFDQLDDTLSYLIKDQKFTYENRLDLNYPYKRFTIVEVPMQFNGKERINTTAREFAQPEMMLLPENGVWMEEADLRQRMSRRNNRRRGERENESELDKQINVFRLATRNTLFARNLSSRYYRDAGLLNNHFSIFPLYYAHTFGIQSDHYDILDQSIESYLNKRLHSENNSWRARANGLTDSEMSNLYLQQNSLAHYLESDDNLAIVSDLIDVKGEYLLTLLNYLNSNRSFDKKMKEFISLHRFENAAFNSFLKYTSDSSLTENDSIFSNWYSSENLPGYAAETVNGKIVRFNGRENYLVTFNITNNGNADGCFSVSFEISSQNGNYRILQTGNYSDDNLVKLYYLKKGETKQISILRSDKVNSYIINTYVSKNMPNELQIKMPEYITDYNMEPADQAIVIDDAVRILQPNEMVCDNTDEGFRIIQTEKVKPVARLFEPEVKNKFNYAEFNAWRPGNWKMFASPQVYGEFIKSAWYVKPGNGSHQAEWKINLPDEGYYNVFAYLHEDLINRPDRRGRNRDEKQGMYQYIIYNEQGADEVLLEADEIVSGWNFLGNYYFNGDSARVKLTNKGESRMVVVADALKWIKTN